MISQEKLEQVLVEQDIRLGQLLIQERLISEVELNRVLEEQRNSNKRLGELLLEEKLVPQEKLQKVVEKQYWQKNGFWLIS